MSVREDRGGEEEEEERKGVGKMGEKRKRSREERKRKGGGAGWLVRFHPGFFIWVGGFSRSMQIVAQCGYPHHSC